MGEPTGMGKRKETIKEEVQHALIIWFGLGELEEK